MRSPSRRNLALIAGLVLFALIGTLLWVHKPPRPKVPSLPDAPLERGRERSTLRPPAARDLTLALPQSDTARPATREARGIQALGTLVGDPDPVACTDSTAAAKAMAIWNVSGGGRATVASYAASGGTNSPNLYVAADVASPMIMMAINCDTQTVSTSGVTIGSTFIAGTVTGRMLAESIAYAIDPAAGVRVAVNEPSYDDTGLSPAGTDIYSWTDSGGTDSVTDVTQFTHSAARLLAYFAGIPSGSRTAGSSATSTTSTSTPGPGRRWA